MARMKILNATEQESFNKPPVFNSFQRKQLFEATTGLMDITQRLRKPTYQIGFLLACGYFKATKRFFIPDDYYPRDVEYVARKLGIESINFIPKNYLRDRVHHHRQLILDFYGFQKFNKYSERLLQQEVAEMARSQLKPKLIFWRCVDLLIQNRIQVPGYDPLSKIVLTGINQRKKELTTVIDQKLTSDARILLDGLFIQEIEGKHARYKLTLLKKLSQSTRPTQIKERSSDLIYMTELYDGISPIFPVLNLGHEGIRYFANSVIKSDMFQLNQRDKEDRYIHVVAFIAHQYYRLQDNLVDTLLSSIKSFQNSAQRDHKDWCYTEHKERNQSFKSIIASLDENIFGVLSHIRKITQDNESNDSDKLTRISNLLEGHNESIPQAEQQWDSLKQSAASEAEGNRYYSILEERSIRLQNRVSPVIKTLGFQCEASASALLEAIMNFKENDGMIDKNAPISFLEPQERKAVTLNDGFRPSLYKALFFMHIAGAIKSGQLNLEHSYKYRPLDEYLISKERWQQEKETLLTRADLQHFSKSQAVLNSLDHALFQQYQTTNSNINNGLNPYLKITVGDDFTVSTPKQEDQEVEMIRPYFPDHHFVPLPEILSTVNGYTAFLDEFQHWQQRYVKGRSADKILYAGIIGLGCAIGAPKMGRISRLINETTLQHTVNWYFSLENIQAANDRVVSIMDQMDLPNVHRQPGDHLHTASDGQKFEVRTDSLNASHSFKYFGKGQGVSVYTFIDERNLLWHSLVFSAAERESAYVIDGLMRNDVIKSDIHSTDTHGYNEAIFATTHLLGFSYAPRIKNLKKQTLYIFKSRKSEDQSDWKIKPGKYINSKVIEDNWDDILRLIATIKLKETTASDIFRRLNSYSRQHPLYQALKAFGQITKSLFILGYIDNVELRQAVESQLNKVELANRFTRAVAVGNPREFTQGGKEEQEIAESCNRLIKNSIICWNYLYLTQKLERMSDQNQKDKLLSAISSHSPISWAHINLLGEYDFSDENLKDSVGIQLPKIIV